jgi:hypothetical protein
LSSVCVCDCFHNGVPVTVFGNTCIRGYAPETQRQQDQEPGGLLQHIESHEAYRSAMEF